MRICSLVFGIGLLAASVSAQCSLQTLSMQFVAPGCNSGPTGCCMLPSAPTTLSGSFDQTNCQLDLTVHQLEGCCGVQVLVRALVIGNQQINFPVPMFGASCTLWVLPVVALARSSGETFSLTLPVGLPSIGFYAQAFALSSDPFLPAPVPTLSAAHSMRLQ